jgi:hypothetical protein
MSRINNWNLAHDLDQGYEMAYFQTENPNVGKCWRVLQCKMLVYFMAIWSILWPFGIFYGYLAYFSRFGMLYQEKSGNPYLDPLLRSWVTTPSLLKYTTPRAAKCVLKTKIFSSTTKNALVGKIFLIVRTRNAIRWVVIFYSAGVVTQGCRIGSRLFKVRYVCRISAFYFSWDECAFTALSAKTITPK